MRTSFLALGLALALLLAACGDDDDDPAIRLEAPFPTDGLAERPPMGWSSWNAFGCDIDEDLIKAQADALVNLGLRDLGYAYVNVDDCWMASERAPNGKLAADPLRFPSGMRALADYVHDRGLKLGLYSSPGPETCNGLPGSLDHESIDAQQYAEWGVDYLKYDRCSASERQTIEGFIRMRTALRSTRRPVVFSVNPNGATWNEHPWRDVAHLWRTTPDIKPVWSKDCSWWCGVLELIDLNEPHHDVAGPGAWNDPDMLEVGVRTSDFAGLSAGEARVHFSLWAIMAAPLIAGADLTGMDADALDAYTNAEIIAVDQDVSGIQGWGVRREGDAEVWVKPLAEPGVRALALVNRGSEGRVVATTWEEALLAPGEAEVRDLWAHQHLGAYAQGYAAYIPGHDVVLLRVAGTDAPDVHEAEALHVETLGSARLADCVGCSGGQKVTHVGNGEGVLRFHGVRSWSATMHQLTIEYASAEPRSAVVRVNAGHEQRVSFPPTGGFDRPATLSLSVPLVVGRNTIELTNPDGWAPDIDRIRIDSFP